MRKLIVLLGAGVLALGLSACDVRPGAGPEKSTKVVTIVAVVDGKPANGFHMEPMTGDNTIDCQYATISRAATTMGVFGGCGCVGAIGRCVLAGEGQQLLCGVDTVGQGLIGWTITAGQLPLGAEPKAEPEPWGWNWLTAASAALGWVARGAGESDWDGRRLLVHRLAAGGCAAGRRRCYAVDRSTPDLDGPGRQTRCGAPDFGPPSRVGVRVAYFAGAQVGG
ncbi:hypothetical protein [Gordonia crocea]|uniref:Lipoprotein n=1 Tax=Gordonia crocea TaxID=589162 RepID=A0A7I9V1A7_9ACTN|nr:hypothetical protein [Gordonia crocea]GED98966.1 hypothetical protein nbrc107697_30050 [Gordonia crocea]